MFRGFVKIIICIISNNVKLELNIVNTLYITAALFTTKVFTAIMLLLSNSKILLLLFVHPILSLQNHLYRFIHVSFSVNLSLWELNFLKSCFLIMYIRIFKSLFGFLLTLVVFLVYILFTKSSSLTGCANDIRTIHP